MIFRIVFCSLVFLLCGATLATAQESAEPVLSKTVTVQSSDGATFYVTRGTLRVPAVRTETQHHHAPITLAFVRIGKSATPAETANILLAGGPGDSALKLAEQITRQGGSQIMTMFVGDIIGIDQRGTGLSTPNLTLKDSYGLPIVAEGNAEIWLPIIREVSRSTAAKLRAENIYPQAYTTRESADDVEAVRQALGYSTINLWGRSYGTHLALEIVRRHSETINRVVLVGPEGPDHTWKRPAQINRVLDRIAKRASDPDLVPRMRRVLAKLDAEPVTVSTIDPRSSQPIEITIGGFDLRWITAQAISDPRALATLPWAYRRMEKGDFSMIAPLAVLFRKGLGPESAMKQFVDLSSGGSATRLQQIEHEAETAVLGDAMNFPARYLASAWGLTSSSNTDRKPVISNVPVLILVGDLDARTPVENGVDLLRTLPNGQLIIVGNAAHQFDLFGNRELRNVLSLFMRGKPTSLAKVDLPPIVFKK